MKEIVNNNKNQRVAMATSEAKSTHTVTSISKERWIRAYNIIQLQKQKQKVRFILDPTLHPDVDECPVELEEPTADESLIYYYDRETMERKTLCVKERYLWRFLCTDQWDGVVRITQGRLIRTLSEYFSQLQEEQKIRTYVSVEYRSLNPGIKECLKRTKRLESEMTGCYRITKEFYFIATGIKSCSSSPIYSKGTSLLSNTLPSVSSDDDNRPVVEKDDDDKHAQCDVSIFPENRNEHMKAKSSGSIDAITGTFTSQYVYNENSDDRQINSENDYSDCVGNDSEINTSLDLTNVVDLDSTYCPYEMPTSGRTTAEKYQYSFHADCSKTSSLEIPSTEICLENIPHIDSVGMETALNQSKTRPFSIILTSNANSTQSAIDENSRYFLPRINQSFYNDCLEGIEKYEIYRESVTSNNNWGKTITEVVIRRKTGETAM